MVKIFSLKEHIFSSTNNRNSMSKRSNLEPIHISCVDRSHSTIQSKIQYQVCRMVKLHRKKFFVSLWVLGKRIAPKYYFDSIRMRMNGRGRMNFLKQYICIELLNTSICSPKHPFFKFNNKARQYDCVDGCKNERTVRMQTL